MSRLGSCSAYTVSITVSFEWGCFCTLELFKPSSYSYLSMSHPSRYLFFSPNTSLKSDILEKIMLVGEELLWFTSVFVCSGCYFFLVCLFVQHVFWGCCKQYWCSSDPSKGRKVWNKAVSSLMSSVTHRWHHLAVALLGGWQKGPFWRLLLH